MAQITYNDYGQAASKAFMGDFENRDHILPGGGQLSADGWTAEGEVLVKLSAAAVATATSLAVDALSGAIPDNTLLDFGGQQARVNGAVAAGATSITVDALAANIADNAEATYDPAPTQDVLPAGTLVGRTNAEKLAGDDYGPAADADDEVYIITDEVDMSGDRGCNLLRHGSVVKYNFLPSWEGASSALKTKLHTLYTLIEG
jgi:hypothetical protein